MVDALELYAEQWGDAQYAAYGSEGDRYRWVLGKLPIRSVNTPTSLLDLGCGRGTWLWLLTYLAPGMRLHGVDLARWCGTPGVGFTPSDLTDPGAPCWDLRYNTVTCLDVLEHLPADAIPGFFERLRPVTRRAIVTVSRGDEPGVSGEELHITQRGHDWWVTQAENAGWKFESPPDLLHRGMTTAMVLFR